jgi:hypothetical protein
LEVSGVSDGLSLSSREVLRASQLSLELQGVADAL